MTIIQVIKEAIKSNKELNSVVRDVSKEAQKTVALVKANGYALDRIKLNNPTEK